jgi:hypothetical protein
VARAGRFAFGLLLAGALSGGAYFAWVSSVGSPSPVDLLPPGAFGVVEARDAEDLARRLSGTRFAEAFARSATREWLERAEPVRAFDAALADLRRVSGISPGRGITFDLLGAEAAAGWYPPTGGAAQAPWVAGGRLSARAWFAATLLRISARFGLGATGVTREEIAGRTLYSFPGGAGSSLHIFLAGRVLVGGSDRSLMVTAARAAGGASAGVTREPAWQAIRGALPARGELFIWVRDRGTIADALPAVSAARAGRGSVGALVRAGKTIEIDVAAEPASARSAAETAGGAPMPLPGIALLRREPLFMVTSRDPVPSALADLLQARRNAVVKRSPGRPAPATAIQPGNGYAVLITDGTGGTGLFPAPRGVVVIGMGSAAEAARALTQLYPPGARTAAGGGTQALATRESFPLAGEFELWGAAVGPQLVFATETSLIDATVAEPDAVTTPGPGDPSWTVGTVASLSMEKLLPLLRRWGAPLSGLVEASWPQGPDVVRDLGLLAAVGTVRVTSGSDVRFDRAAVTLTVHDLPGR